MIPRGHPIKYYIVVQQNDELTPGEIVYEFSKNNFYKVEIITRDNRYEIKILNDLDSDKLEGVIHDVTLQGGSI